MMSSGSFYKKMSNKVVPYLAAKLSHKQHSTGGAKSSNYKRVVDDLNRMMMCNNRDKKKKKRTWRKLGSSRSSAASVIFSMFGSSNQMDGTGEGKGRFHKVVKAKNGIWGGGRVRVLRWFKKSDDHRADSVGSMNAEKRSSKISRVFWKVADSKKLKLVQRISVRKQAKRERKGFELCKRRILMGVKCKPVNASGKLHYGRDGVILAEDQAF